MTVLLGTGGAFVAGRLGVGMGWYRNREPVGFIASVGGAVILLCFYRVLRGRKA